MKSVKALLFVMVFGLIVLAGCSGKPEEVTTDDTATKDIVVPVSDSVDTTVEVTGETADTTADTSVETDGTTTTDDTVVTETDDDGTVPGETAE